MLFFSKAPDEEYLGYMVDRYLPFLKKLLKTFPKWLYYCKFLVVCISSGCSTSLPALCKVGLSNRIHSCMYVY